jgi:hypothetical protein
LNQNAFFELNYLLKESSKIEPLFRINTNRLYSIDMWEFLDLFSEIPNFNIDTQRKLDIDSKPILIPEVIDENAGFQTTKDMVSLKPSSIDSDLPYKSIDVDFSMELMERTPEQVQLILQE